MTIKEKIVCGIVWFIWTAMFPFALILFGAAKVGGFAPKSFKQFAVDWFTSVGSSR